MATIYSKFVLLDVKDTNMFYDKAVERPVQSAILE